MLYYELAGPVVDPALEGAASVGPKDWPRRHWRAEQGEPRVKVGPHKGLHLRRQRGIQSVALARACVRSIAVANEDLLQGRLGLSVRRDRTGQARDDHERAPHVAAAEEA